MENEKFYTQMPLAYSFNELAPYISEAQLKIHFEKHHSAYVNAANTILEKIDKARAEGSELDLKAILKNLSFNIGGHILHALFWSNLAPSGKGGGGEPSGKVAEAIIAEFGSFERFKKEFTASAAGVEGSGWGALTYCKETGRITLMQIEKHNVNIIPSYPILLIVDVFEHAYYLDYQNERGKYLENIWHVINWEEVDKRFITYK